MNEKNKFEKFVDYLCDPIVKFVVKNNKHEKIQLQNRSLWSKILTIITGISTLLTLYSTIISIVSYVQIIANDLDMIATAIIGMIQISNSLLLSYIMFAFSYYFDITFGRWLKFMLLLILQILAALIIFVLIMSDSAVLMTIFHISTTVIALYNSWSSYAKEYLRVYEDH